uniref:Uncharacterized protein n=1 Tax=Rhizophora mucronata TaxID=61149 RepID=A0A2P2MYY8_RHIMU
MADFVPHWEMKFHFLRPKKPDTRKT